MLGHDAVTMRSSLAWKGWLFVVPALLLGACAADPSTPPPSFTQPVVLLGEVHDNAAQHALRLRAFEAWLAQGARPALLMEQFDRNRQAQIDRLLAREPRPSAAAFVNEVVPDRRGWDWRFYEPFIALALQHGLPIVAANVSRDEARNIMRQGLAAQGFDDAVPSEIGSSLARSVLDSHCGMLDEPTAARMALAQVARDQFMARMVERHAPRGVLLLAGNGHVRTDVGVPRWLSPATRARTEAIGMLERDGGMDAGLFDRVVITAPQSREDPCAAMRKAGPLRAVPTPAPSPAAGAASSPR
jgi:uncharacterized iron-regulated protein